MISVRLQNLQPSPQFYFMSFSMPSKEILGPFTSTPLYHPQPQATSNLLSVSMGWPVLDTPYKWNHTYVFFCSDLTSSVEHKIFEVHPCCSMCPHVIASYPQILFDCVDIPHVFIRSSVDGHLCHFHFLPLVSDSGLNIHV